MQVEEMGMAKINIDEEQDTTIETYFEEIPIQEKEYAQEYPKRYPGEKQHSYCGPNPQKKILSPSQRKKKRKQQKASRKRNR